MYDDSSTTDTESLSSHISVASILGIKGGLRIRHHTTSQKAHVVLRRVEGSENSSDDGKENDVVYFRLFANKNINLKAGKELLLTIASGDGRLKDQVVMFEGNVRGSEEDSDHEGTTQVEEEPQVIEEEEEIIPHAAMPPKMRRQWNKKVEEVSPVVFKMPVAYTSVGVQAQPVYASSSVQATASRNSVSIQVSPPPLPSYSSLDVQTDPILLSVESINAHPTFPSQEPERAASLSPMQLSPPGSPFITSPPLSLEIPGQYEPSEDMEMSPLEVKAEETEATLPILSSLVVQVKQEVFRVKAEIKQEFLDPPISVCPPPRTPPLMRAWEIKQEFLNPPVLVRPPPRTPHPVINMFDLEDSPEPTSFRPPPQNSFVSGGFVTDFVGVVSLPTKEAPLVVKTEEPPIIQTDSFLATHSSATSSLPVPPELLDRPQQTAQSGSHRRRATKRARLRAEAQAALPADAVNPPAISEGASAIAAFQGIGARDESTSASQSLLQRLVLPVTAAHARDPPENAVASSSKAVSTTSPPAHSPHASTSILPRAVPLINRTKEKAPVDAGKRRHYEMDITASSSSTPPPELKAIARITAGPSSNPLSIRPSNSFPSSTLARPATSTPGAPKAKKRVVVGRGWPFVRAPATTPTASPVSPSSHSVSKPGNGPASKWKRIDNEISISVPPRDDSPVDMVISEPPSPVSGPSLPLPTTSASFLIPSHWKDQVPLSLDTRPRLLDGLSSDVNQVQDYVESDISPLSCISPDTAAAPNPPPQTATLHPPTPPQKPCATSSRVNAVTPAPNPKSTPAQRQQKKPLVQLPTHPSLPAKPPPMVAPLSYGPTSRGVKRERPPSADLWTAPGIVRVPRRKRRSHTVEWSTVECTHADTLQGHGDLGIRTIAFSTDNNYFALNCRDRTLRIWNSKTRLEIARLSHNSQVIALAWLDDEMAVMSLGEDGVLGKWTRIGEQNQWEWGRVINVGSEKCAPEDAVCLAYARDRIAVSFPKTGVKVWIWCKGSWLAQRSIMRTNVTALKFIDGGDALLGGTREGVVWHCAVPNGTMKVYAFLQSSITSICINPTGMQALIAQAGGSACLVSLGSQDEKRIGQSYLEVDLRDGTSGAIFMAKGKTIVFGTVDGYLLAWDAQKGAILYGMEHEDGDLIQTVASCDGPQGYVVAGTREGRLIWWPELAGPSLAQCLVVSSPSNTSWKRAKVK
ncbi:hypothetical protein B0H19DRAFT_1162953 [Mycena capillaripes]|nr:hypothetical protein B0H19DRAFT_1162953 [Mycena capillaripes]